MKRQEPKTRCRTPNAQGVTNIPKWKFEALRAAILDAIDHAGPSGLLFKDINEAVKTRLTQDQLSRLGSVGWHATSVKLELEVAGEIKRVAKSSPQRIIKA